MILILFWPAGTLNWPEAWIYLVLQLGFSTAVAIYLNKHDPSLLQKRMQMRIPPKLWDKIIVIPFGLAMIALLIVPGFDAIRYGWSDIPFYFEIIGFIGFIISSYLLFLVMKENTYLLKTVEIQKNHKVVQTGPYAYVRHPMYSAVIIMVFSIALALGSLYTLIPAFLASLSLAIRTSLEDLTLQKELTGYKNYTKKVTYKLIPHIW